MLERRDVRQPGRCSSKAGALAVRLRDEAHRFAIGAHRAKRSKAIGATPLDEAPGIGPARKRALLAHFGSAKAVARAGLSDLKAVDGISEKMAESLFAFFQGNG